MVGTARISPAVYRFRQLPAAAKSVSPPPLSGRLFTPAGEIPVKYFAGEIGEIGDISPRTLRLR
jgi:hypothetical protein